MNLQTTGSASRSYNESMRHVARGIVAAAVAMLMVVTIVIPTRAVFADDSSTETTAKTTASTHKYNIVFVIDNSGSTVSTDPNLFRKAAIDYFLAIMTDSGNYVGGIIFQSTPVSSTEDLLTINSAENKHAISEFFNLPQGPGATDIGTAVFAATQMLERSGDPNLPSAIILMTDGRTEDIPNINQSYANRDAAIESAVVNEYPIFCVGLDADGSVDGTELQNIADQTGGKYIPVSSAADLPNVFETFYELLYGTERNTIFEGDGSFDVNFKVPAVGVEDVNIIIYSSQRLQSLELYQPSGPALSQEEIDGITTVSSTFTVVKITNPLKGEWRVAGQGADNDHVKIDMMQNFNLDVVASIKDEAAQYPVDGGITLTARIFQSEQPVDDQEAYADYSAAVLVDNDPSFSSPVETQMSEGDVQYEGTITPDAEGTLYAKVILTGEYFTDTSDTIKIAVEGTAAASSGGATQAIQAGLDGFPLIPIFIAAILVLVAVAAFILLKKRRRSQPELFGNMKIVVRRNYEAAPADWRRLAPYGKEVTLFELLDKNSEFDEINGIRVLGDESAVRVVGNEKIDIYFFNGQDGNDVRLRDSEGFEIRLQDGVTTIECTWSRS
jgi:Mg-chelatase subunit ChlD